MFGKLNHIAVFVKDLEQSIEFYENILEADLLFSTVSEGDGLKIAMLQMEDYKIELIQPPAGADDVAKAAEATQNHFAISVADVEKAFEFVKSKGCECEKEGVYVVNDFGFAGNDIKVAFFRGPNGERIELFQKL